MTDKTIVYIDGDLLAFKASAAAEKRSVKVFDSSGNYAGEYKTRTEFKATIPKEQHSEYEFEDIQTPDKIENALHTVKKMIQTIVTKSDADEYFTALSGKYNFRDNLPLPSKYKGKRVDMLRPLLLNDVKDYIINHHDCIITNGYEADDWLSMKAYEGWKTKQKIIQASIDKDAYQCNGWLLDWDKMDEPLFIDGFGKLSYDTKKGCKGEGNIWLLAQSLMGDATDCYKPSELSGKKFGDAGCYTILKDCKTYKAAYQAVYDQYKEWYPNPVTYTAWDGTEHTKDALGLFQMYFDCARMLRWEGDVIQLTDVLDKLGIIYD